MAAPHRHALNGNAALSAAISAVTGRLARPSADPLPEAEGPLARVREAFALTPFELGIVTLCAAAELSAEAAQAIGAAHRDAQRTLPTFGLAISHLPGAHWDALRPDGPLRRWRLLSLGEGERLTGRPLRLSETVLHALVGVRGLEASFTARARPLDPPPDALAASHLETRDALIALLREGEGHVHLVGAIVSARDIFAAACAEVGGAAWALPASLLPADAEEREALLSTWARDALLWGDRTLVEIGGAADAALVTEALAHAPTQLVLGGWDRLPDAVEPPVVLPIAAPAWSDRMGWWRAALGEDAKSVDVGALAATFALSATGVRGATRAAVHQDPRRPLQQRLWRAAATLVRPRLDDLAARVDVRATLDDLILPPHDHATLQAIIAQLKHRATVWHAWGFAAASNRGHGTTAVFAGPSGTGKSLAAEAIAHALDLDLYRIDLSAVVSKYIGETEKNLRRIFDAAEDGGAVLLFDEADALFGKRTEVKDSHDRHANIEVSYLLQRMEAYQGLAVLTTNLRRDIDDAFLRRFQFVIDFTFPDIGLRERLWRHAFPAATPLDGVNPARLARLAITGGHIKNIARNAAFLAAGDGGVVRMPHLLAATRQEYAKLGQPLTPADIRHLEGG